MASCFIEQTALTKKGSSCIIGSVDKRMQWGLLTADFLLLKALQSCRFDGVICVASDRNVNLLHSIEQLANTQRERKLRILNVEVDTSLLSIEDSLRRIKEEIGSKMEHPTRTPTIAVFIFSISELIFRHNLTSVASFLDKLTQLSSSHISASNSSTSTSTSTSSSYSAADAATTTAIAAAPKSAILQTPEPLFHAVLGVVHETLHNPSTLHYIQSLFDTVIAVRPNDGTHASIAAAQTHCLRKSPHTGKVSEEVELFGLSHGMLVPLQSAASSNSSSQSSSSSSSDASSSSSSATTSSATNISMLVDSTSTSASTSASTSTSTSTSSSTSGHTAASKPSPEAAASIARLITFDSTDPEFDEDSDPDNDLDL